MKLSRHSLWLLLFVVVGTSGLLWAKGGDDRLSQAFRVSVEIDDEVVDLDEQGVEDARKLVDKKKLMALADGIIKLMEKEKLPRIGSLISDDPMAPSHVWEKKIAGFETVCDENPRGAMSDKTRIRVTFFDPDGEPIFYLRIQEPELIVELPEHPIDELEFLWPRAMLDERDADDWLKWISELDQSQGTGEGLEERIRMKDADGEPTAVSKLFSRVTKASKIKIEVEKGAIERGQKVGLKQRMTATVREVMDRICNEAGASWEYNEDDKRIHVKPR